MLETLQQLVVRKRWLRKLENASACLAVARDNLTELCFCLVRGMSCNLKISREQPGQSTRVWFSWYQPKASRGRWMLLFLCLIAEWQDIFADAERISESYNSVFSLIVLKKNVMFEEKYLVFLFLGLYLAFVLSVSLLYLVRFGVTNIKEWVISCWVPCRFCCWKDIWVCGGTAPCLRLKSLVLKPIDQATWVAGAIQK